MKIQLKKIYFSEQMSEETNAFTADLWINGKKIAYVKNDGHGGCTNYNTYDPSLRPILKEAENYCESLPSVKYNNHDLPMNLEFKLDLLLEDWLNLKDYKKAIVYTAKDGSTREVTWKGNSITKLLKMDSGVTVLKIAIKRIKSQGGVIKNTNLGSLID